ncbi:unnamed protein product [Cuscuta epithymum]|uniref:Uncharacterized protein n=1 Tax=Cuscuta epithymum TaxID=186058 RepID=A0AAV0D2C3_9ASTE|nr:unnamed protein product [Cuscuta epithymum]
MAAKEKVHKLECSVSKMTIPCQQKEGISSDSIPISSSTFPITWKLYENPCYHIRQRKKLQDDNIYNQSQVSQQIYLPPISTRKIAASFWKSTFFRPSMESMLETAQTQIMELKAELENEQKRRKKLESLNKKLVKHVFEERKEGKQC